MQMQSNCLHLIPDMTEKNYGTYKCVSKEKAYINVVKTYHLKDQQPVARYRNYIPAERDHAPTVVLQMAWIKYGVILAVLWIFR